MNDWRESLLLMTQRAFIYEWALLEILEMAERSDAHPDLQFAEVARRAMDQAGRLDGGVEQR